MATTYLIPPEYKNNARQYEIKVTISINYDGVIKCVITDKDGIRKILTDQL